MHRRFVFRVRGHVLRDFVRFWSVYLTAVGINAVALPLLVELGMPRILAQAIIVRVHRAAELRGPPGLLFPARCHLDCGRDLAHVARTAVTAACDGAVWNRRPISAASFGWTRGDLSFAGRHQVVGYSGRAPGRWSRLMLEESAPELLSSNTFGEF